MSAVTYEVSREASVRDDDGNVVPLFQYATAAVRAATEDGRVALHVLPKGAALRGATDQDLIDRAAPHLLAKLEEPSA